MAKIQKKKLALSATLAIGICSQIAAKSFHNFEMTGLVCAMVSIFNENTCAELDSVSQH